jgi:hypothetical protein
MREISGDLFEFHKKGNFICIPTNGVVKSNGELVMGAGVALTAAKIYPSLPAQLGKLVKRSGNVPFLFEELKLMTFPTKFDWKNKSSLGLIKTSAEEVVKLANNAGLDRVYLPRVGVGLGSLQWSDVKVVLDDILDWRFIVVNNDLY